MNSGRVTLLDNTRLIAQLVGLERHVARSGKDAVDHPPGSHDDLINAAAGALVTAHIANRTRLRIGVYGAPGTGCELDPVTFRPLDAPERARVRWVRIPESLAPAARGP